MPNKHKDEVFREQSFYFEESEETSKGMKKAVLMALIATLVLIWAPINLEAEAIAAPPKPVPRVPNSVKLAPKPQKPLEKTIINKYKTRRPMPASTFLEPPVEIEPLDIPEPESFSSDPLFEDILPDPPVSGETIFDRTTTNLERPLFTYKARPNYPPIGKKLRMEGSVLLEAVLNADGSISDIRVIRELGLGRFGFEREAVKALEQWRFEPGRINGKPVNVRMRLQIGFNLTR